MPVSLSGVMLVEYSVPNGNLNPRPPAYSWPPWVVWQTMQSAAFARYAPRSTRLALASEAGTPVGSAALYSASATFGPSANAIGPGPRMIQIATTAAMRTIATTL